METVISRFVEGLKSPSEDVRLSTAVELRRYVASDLKEAFSNNYADFIEDLCCELEGMLAGNESSEKRGAILAIGA